MFAEFVFRLCLFSAVAMGLGMILLIARRFWRERRLRHEGLLSRAFAQSLFRRIAGAAMDRSTDKIPLRIKLDAMTELLQLLRGAEKDALLRLAEDEGLFRQLLKQLQRRRPTRRADAIRMLERFGGQQCVDGLRQVMAEDPVIELRLEAASSLARMNQLSDPGRLMELLSLRDQPLTRLHQALFRSFAVTDVAALVRLLQDDLPEQLHAIIVDALGWGGDFSVLPALEQAASARGPEIRCAALRAARQLGHPASRGWMIALLRDPSEIVRLQAARSCAALGLKEATPLLEELRHDPAFWVRLRAEQALVMLDRPIVKSA